MSKLSDIPIPRRMRALPRDHRGYPVPFVVLRDADNKPHFAINNDLRVLKCLREERCPICGYRLDKIIWFIGGPGSAFHDNGRYLDPPMHEECAMYALQVCPYLAAPNYDGCVDAGTLDPTKLPRDCPAVFMNLSQDDTHPQIFAAVATWGRTFKATYPHYITPARPYVRVEFWRHGVKLSDVTPEGTDYMHLLV